MWFPTIDFILILYQKQISPSPSDVINLEGIKGTIDKVIFGIPYHQSLSIFEQATILYREIIMNHYFFDGNKRIAVLIMILFLEKNGFHFKPPKGDIYSVTIKTAEGKTTFEEIRNWIKKYTHR